MVGDKNTKKGVMIIFSLMFIILSFSTVSAVSKYEYYETIGGVGTNIYLGTCKIQTFTIGAVGTNESFITSSVYVAGRDRSGSKLPDNLNVSILSGVDVIASGVRPKNQWPTGYTALEVEISEATLNAGQQYTMRVCCPDCPSYGESFTLNFDSGGSYPGGAFSDGGDMYFQTWGDKLEDLSIDSPTNSSYNTNIILIDLSSPTGDATSFWFTNSTGQNETWISAINKTYSEGGYRLYAYSNNSGGNVTEKTVDFSVFFESPTINIAFPQNTTHSSVITELNYTAIEDNLDSCWYSVDGGATNSSADSTCSNFTGLNSGQGSSSWTVYANTTFGKIGNSIVTFFVDSIFSDINYTNPTYSSGYGITEYLPINVTANDTNLANITIYIYNSTGSLINSSYTESSPNYVNKTLYYDDTYFFNATACDIANNCNSTETRNVTATIPRNITYCKTIMQSGSYILTEDLESDGTCLLIEGEDIEISGNGHSILFGISGGTAYGILVQDSDNITIRDFNITAGSVFASTNETSGITIRGTVQNSLFYNNTIKVYNGGIDGIEPSSSSINNNYSYNDIHSVGRNDMEMDVLINDTITNNIFRQSNSAYLDFDDMENVYVGDNVFVGSGTWGVLFSGLTENVVFENNTNFAGFFDLGLNIINLSFIDQNIGRYDITNATINIENTTYGKVSFINNFSGYIASNLYPGIIDIWNNSILINDSIMGENKSANLYLYGLATDYILPKVFRNGIICDSTTSPSCNNLTSLNAGDIIFNVSSGGTYNIGEGDLTPPDVTINSPLNITYNTNEIVFNVTVLDAISDLDSCWYTLNSGIDNFTMYNSTGNIFNSTNYSMAQGGHNVIFYCNDSAGNTNGTESTSFFIDSIFPLIDYGTGTESDGTNTSQSNVYVNVSVTETNEDTITFNLYYSNNTLLNSTPYTDSTRTINWTSLDDGLYYYNITVNDSAGNTNNTETRSIRLDTTYPSITLLGPGDSTEDTDGFVDFSFNVSDDLDVSNCSLYLGSSLESTLTSITKGTTMTFSVQDPTKTNSLSWYITCYDQLSNSGDSSTRTLDTLEGDVDDGGGSGGSSGGGSSGGSWNPNPNIDTTLCDYAYEHILEYGDEYSKVSILNDFLDSLGYDLSDYSLHRAYIQNWQQVCSKNSNKTLEPQKVCSKIYYFILDNNWNYTQEDIFNLKKILEDDVDIDYDLLQYYIDNNEDLCFKEGYSSKLPNKPTSSSEFKINKNFFIDDSGNPNGLTIIFSIIVGISLLAIIFRTSQKKGTNYNG